MLGEPIPALDPDLRRCSVGKYVIYYKLLKRRVRIVRVLHAYRNTSGLL
jgi:plasmid stabilization system protein ParE